MTTKEQELFLLFYLLIDKIVLVLNTNTKGGC